MRPWRAGRAMKPHDYTSWLRGLTTVHPCTDAKLARIYSGHPAGLFCATSPPRNGMKVKGKQRRCVVRRVAADAVGVSFDPPARSCWQVLDGKAAQRDALGARLRSRHRMCLRPNPASACAPARLHRAGDWPSGRIFWLLFCASRKVTRGPAGARNALQTWRQSAPDARNSSAQRSTSLATAETSAATKINSKIKMGRRIRVDDEVGGGAGAGPSPWPSPEARGRPAATLLPTGEGKVDRMNRP